MLLTKGNMLSTTKNVKKTRVNLNLFGVYRQIVTTEIIAYLIVTTPLCDQC